MKTEGCTGPNPSLWTWIAEWWQARSRRHAAVIELDGLDPAVVAGISRELGTSVGEFRALAGRAGFRPVETWTDPAKLFSVHYFRLG